MHAESYVFIFCCDMYDKIPTITRKLQLEEEVPDGIVACSLPII